jgi:hypothetical protein
MKCLLAIIFFSFFFSGSANADQSQAAANSLSKEQKQFITNTLRFGTFANRWRDGEMIVHEVSQEFFRMSDANHAKEYDKFDPIGLFYGFSSAYSQPDQDLTASGDPVSSLESNLVQLTTFLKPFWPWVQTDPDVFPDLAQVAIGIYYEADLVKGITTGKVEQLNDIQTFTVNRIFQGIEATTVDPSTSIAVLKYFRARHSNFSSSFLYDVANSLYQTALQTYGVYETGSSGEMKKKNPYKEDDKKKSECLLIAAANYYAMAALSTNTDQNFSFMSSEVTRRGAVGLALSLADQFHLPTIPKRVLPVAIAFAKTDGDSVALSQMEENLISHSSDIIGRKTFLDRVCITVRRLQLKWSEAFVSLYLLVLGTLLVSRSWQLGPQLRSSQKCLMKPLPWITRVLKGGSELGRSYFFRGTSTLSLQDRIILGLIAFGLGSIIPLMKERADFVMQSLLGG